MHKSYECSKKKGELYLVEEEQEEENKEPIYDEKPIGDLEEKHCDSKNLVIWHVMTDQEDDQWLKHNSFKT